MAFASLTSSSILACLFLGLGTETGSELHLPLPLSTVYLRKWAVAPGKGKFVVLEKWDLEHLVQQGKEGSALTPCHRV